MGTFLERVVVLVQGITGKFNQTMANASRRVKNYGSALQVARRSMRAFKMEMLGVMFFGMAMQRTFTGLLQPVMEAFGVFDLFREMLLILFLPVMEMLFPVFLKIFDFFTNLPGPVKLVIGAIAVLGAIFGTILSVIGQLSLGQGALLKAFSLIPKAVSMVGAAISGAFLVVAAVVVAIIIGMIVAWKENFAGMKSWVNLFLEGIKSVFRGIFNVIAGIIDLFVSLVKGDFDGVGQAISRMFNGIVSIVEGIIATIVGAVVSISIGVLRVFKGIVDGIVGFFDWLWGKLVGASIIPDLVNAIIDWFWKIPSKVFDMLESIVTKATQFGKDFVNAIINGIKSVGSKIKDTVGGFIGGVKEFGGSLLGGERFNDFIMRPGQAPISINPADTVVGFKGEPPGFGGGGVVFNQTLNINVSNQDLIRREIDNANRRTVDELRRIVKS